VFLALVYESRLASGLLNKEATDAKKVGVGTFWDNWTTGLVNWTVCARNVVASGVHTHHMGSR
jgi:hypothetical protein